MFKGQGALQNSTDAMQAVILQYINEVTLSRSRNSNNSVMRRTLKSKIERKSKSRNKGYVLSF